MAHREGSASITELAAKLGALSVLDQLEVLRRSLRRNGKTAPKVEFRAALEKVLREDRAILETLSD